MGLCVTERMQVEQAFVETAVPYLDDVLIAENEDLCAATTREATCADK